MVPLANTAKASITSKLDHNQAQIQSVQSLLSTIEKDYSAAEKSLKNTEIEYGQLKKQLTAIEFELTTLEEKETLLRTEIKTLNSKKQQQQQALAAELTLLYQLPKEDVIKQILNQQDLSDQVRLSQYYQSLQQARLERLQQYQSNLKKIEQASQQLLSVKQQRSLTKEQLFKTQAMLKTTLNKRSNALASIDQNLNNHKRQLEHLNSEREVLLKNLAKWQASYKQTSRALAAISPAKGALSWPVSGKILHAFGSQYPGSHRQRKGIFIKTGSGQPVRAIFEGKVIFANWLRGYGLLCILEHSQGVFSLYGHNASLAVKLGDYVSKDERIATTGQSGGLEQAGLYFEIRQKGQPKDPITWLSRR